MQMPVLIEPLTDRPSYVARLGAPFTLSAEAPTPDEALRQLTDSLQRCFRVGARLALVSVPEGTLPAVRGGWLPDDDLTREWRDAVEAYRKECDAEDRQRILSKEDRNCSS
jgi:hypothetical protein